MQSRSLFQILRGTSPVSIATTSTTKEDDVTVRRELIADSTLLHSVFTRASPHVLQSQTYDFEITEIHVFESSIASSMSMLSADILATLDS